MKRPEFCVVATNPQGHDLTPLYVRGVRPALSLWWAVRRSKGWKARIRIADSPLPDARRAVMRVVRAVWDRRDPRYKVAAYSLHQGYAGPEEGGRWYTDRCLEHVVKVWRSSTTFDVEDALAEEYPSTGYSSSAWPRADYAIYVYGPFEAVPTYVNNHPGPYC